MEEIINERKKEIKIITILVVMSFFAGIFISYYISYISALFVKFVGPDRLPLAYIVSGLGGTLVTNLYNKLEIKYSFLTVTSLFVAIISLSLLIVWHYCTSYTNNNLVIFLSYSWFWVSGNFVLLVFWKLPTNLLNLGQNKKFTGLISSGEVISAIIAYLSVPFIISQGLLNDESTLLLISLFGIICFLILLFILPIKKSLSSKDSKLKNESEIINVTFFELLKTPFFRLIFFSVLFSVVVQSTIDYSLMLITKEVITDTKYLAAFFGSIFGFSKLLEFILKTTLSNKMLKLFGVQVGLFTFGIVIGIVTVLGLFSNYLGAITLLFIATLMSKIMERSLSRSLFTPSISILFQVYVGKIKSIVQNYGDGLGKTFGQLIAGVVLLGISYSSEFYLKFTLLHIFIIISVGIILKMSFILTPLYREKLMNRIANMVSFNGTFENSNLVVIPENINRFDLKSIESSNILYSNTLPALPEKDNGFDSKICYYNIKSQIEQEFILMMYFKNLSTENMDTGLISLKKYNFDTIHLILDTLINENKFLLPKSNNYFELLQMVVEKYCHFISILNILDESECTDLKLSIQSEIRTFLEIIFKCLSLVNDKKVVHNTKILYGSFESENQIIAIEILGLLLDKQEKALLLPIFQETNGIKILKKLDKFIPVIRQNYSDTIISLVLHSPALLDVNSRYFALVDAVNKKIISDDQLITVCFSCDSIIKNYAYFALREKSEDKFLELSSRTNYNIPIGNKIRDDYYLVKNLNLSSLPNSIKSKLLQCISYSGSDYFEIKDPDLYILVKKRYPDFIQEIDIFINGPKISNLITK
jgi:hypothetical protein